jgi:hypothetical protein
MAEPKRLRSAALRHKSELKSRTQSVSDLAKCRNGWVRTGTLQFRDLLLRYSGASGERGLCEAGIEPSPTERHSNRELGINNNRNGAASLGGSRRRAPVYEMRLQPTG